MTADPALIEDVARAICRSVWKHRSDETVARLVDLCWPQYQDQSEAAIDVITRRNAERGGPAVKVDIIGIDTSPKH